MRIAVISDVHGNLPALETVFAHIHRDYPDVIVNLGDVASAPLWPLECAEMLAAVATVRGNHDRWLADPDAHVTPTIGFTRATLTDEHIRRLSTNPSFLKIEGDDILAVHGTPGSDTQYLLEDLVDGRVVPSRPDDITQRLDETTATLVLCGHSHTQRVVQIGEVTIVNPGSVGSPRYAENTDLARAESGSPHARYATLTRSSSGKWTADLHVLGYDFDAVANQARSNGREDWAHGFMR